MARRTPPLASRTRRNDTTPKRTRPTPKPPGLGPGRVYDCNDPLIGTKVSGRDFSGTVLGCVTPPEGERGHRLAVGSSPRAASVKATVRARKKRLFRSKYGPGSVEAGRPPRLPSFDWGLGPANEVRRGETGPTMPSRWIDRVATAAASILAYFVRKHDVLFRSEGLSEAAIAQKLKNPSWSLNVGRDYTVIRFRAGYYTIRDIHVDMKQDVGIAYMVNDNSSPRRGYPVGSIEFPSSPDERSVYNFNWFQEDGRGMRLPKGETIPVVYATVDMPDPIAKIAALREKSESSARDPESKSVRYWRPSAIPGPRGMWSPEANPLGKLAKKPTISNTVELNKLIRDALYDAVSSGVLPEMEFSVIKQHHGSITVTILDVRGITMVTPRDHGDEYGRHYDDTPDYEEFIQRVTKIVNQWNYSESIAMTDYYRQGYYETITDNQYDMEVRAANSMALGQLLVDKMLTDSIRKNLDVKRTDLAVVVVQPGTHYRVMRGQYEKVGLNENAYFKPRLAPSDGTEQGERWRVPLVAVDAYSPEEAQVVFAGILREREAEAAAKRSRTNGRSAAKRGPSKRRGR